MSRRYLVELSGEAPALARAELEGAVEALRGSLRPPGPGGPGLLPVELPDDRSPTDLAGRLALARRVLVTGSGLEERWRAERLPEGTTGAFRTLGHPSRAPGESPRLRQVVAAFKAAGGRVDLDRPRRRFWIVSTARGERLLEEVAAVDRAAYRHRRMPGLPFQRPIALDPRLARAAMNLARIRPGETVVDPFLGTGALLAEAGLLGAHTYGIDRSDEMVRGALRNLDFLGVPPDGVAVDDGSAASTGFRVAGWDAVVTDPPYGRSSSPGSETPDTVRRRVLAAWAERMPVGARAVVIAPVESPPLDPPWDRVEAIPVRVHRSLTREFSRYRRGR
ncbi:MAG: TRM11 family SAM-dependent methyltransferase [Thermoplasmata archaeon]